MSNYANTKATIAANVYTNHNNEVTAAMVKTGINAVVDTLIAGGFLYKGVAHPGDAAVSPDANVFYIASEAGTYTNKGGLVVADGEVAILKYNGSWSKEVTGAATAAEVSALGQEVGERDGDVPLDLGQSSAGYYTGSTGQTIGSTTSNGYKYAGIDISAYVGYQISIGILNPSSATSRRTAICDADDKILIYWGEGDFSNGNPKLYEVKPGDKWLYCSAQKATSTFSVYVKEYPTGIFSDISKINKELGLKADASKLYDVERVAGYPVSLSFGGKYNTYGAKGAVASMAYSADSNWANYNELANKGDIFYIYGNGGVSPKLWAFLEIGTNVIIDAAEENAIGVDTMIVAPSDCRVVININMLGASTYRVMKVINKVGAIINRDELTRLNALYDEPLVKIPYFMGFAGIIHHWGFIGDSLMSGYMEREGTSFSQYEYSWGQRMCAMLGVEGYNFSQGGQTAKGWINGAGIPERSWAGAKTNLQQGYIIGMGANDRSESYPLGDVTTDIGTYDPVTDTDTNADSFAGYYAGMIQRIQSVQPTAKIFVVTLPYQPTRDVNPYNEVIRAMCSIFSNVYLIDMYAYARNYYLAPGWSNLFDTNHLNVIGYEYTAYVMMTYIDWIIRNNYSAFKKVNEIPV